MVEPFLGGKSLSKAIDKKEIYIIDLKDIEGISVPSGRTVGCSFCRVFNPVKSKNILNLQEKLRKNYTEIIPCSQGIFAFS